MKRFAPSYLYAAIMCLVFTLQAAAAPVDVATAQAHARQYLASKVYAGKFMAPAATQPTLIKTVMGDKSQAPALYIFNTATTFVIVSADDRAEEILAVGDRPLNLDRIPCNMQAWLDSYKDQIDWLLTHPDAKVDRPTTYKSPKLRDTRPIGPLLTALWDQTEPFWDQCQFEYNGTTYQCYTGCPATSASMILYYWKYPIAEVGPIPAYTSSLDLGSWNSVSYTYAALPAVTFDWDNMIDDYYLGEYTPEQGAAVATLMRYVGQCEHMMYGTYEAGGSGIYTTDTQVIADMYIGFGYDETTCRFVRKSDYTEQQWAQMLQEEIIEHRPVVFCGIDPSAGGHAFNVDGYDSSLNKYHVNFGWSGDGNNWFAMNAFTGGSYTFSDNQRMVLGIQPPSGKIMTTPEQVTFDGFAGETYTRVVRVQARNIESDITLALSDSPIYSLSTTTITPEQAMAGHDVTITYAPSQAGSSSATLTLSCSDEGVESVTVPLTGEAKPRVPTLIVEPASLNFAASLSSSITKTISLTGAFLTSDVTLSLTDYNDVFTVSPATIPQSETDVNTPVEVTVTFNSPSEGSFTGALTIASEGAQSITVPLKATANAGGTASDPYLNIIKYETIDEAGWDTSAIRNLYAYTVHDDEQCAWLTVSNYGVLVADATQSWFTNSGTRLGDETWSATDVFMGSDSYFDGEGVFTDWSEDYQTFYVTNCSQVKQYAQNRNSITYPLKMYVYECTANPDGSITPCDTAIQVKQSVTTTKEVLESDPLDPSKIYKIAIFNDYSKLYEIAFKTPIDLYDSPVATSATQVAATKFTAHWMPCLDATSYTLRVSPLVATSLLSETFAACTATGAQNIANSLDSYCDNAGWTGNNVYSAPGGLRLGSGTNGGSITTPAIDLSTTLGKAHVKLTAHAFTTNSGTSDTNCNLVVSCGDACDTVVVAGGNEQEFIVPISCTQALGQHITLATTTKGKRVIVTNVEVYNGEPTSGTDAEPIIVNGLDGTSFTVTGLKPATNYFYDLKAIYSDGESNWGNKIQVTTLAGGLVGDVNCDGEVTSYDITCLYNYLLNGDETFIATSDVDGDGFVTTADITAIYNILLNE